MHYKWNSTQLATEVNRRRRGTGIGNSIPCSANGIPFNSLDTSTSNNTMKRGAKEALLHSPLLAIYFRVGQNDEPRCRRSHLLELVKHRPPRSETEGLRTSSVSAKRLVSCLQHTRSVRVESQGVLLIVSQFLDSPKHSPFFTAPHITPKYIVPNLQQSKQ